MRQIRNACQEYRIYGSRTVNYVPKQHKTRGARQRTTGDLRVLLRYSLVGTAGSNAVVDWKVELAKQVFW